jgi:NADPH-dependent glutamate synthase beta subunit-like oxidoreductase/NAD-dependent dihydropyrimidine dehydrogenase PreA subunit
MIVGTRTGIPKNSVLVAGSGYGALKAAEDLVQSGIPVVWVTRAPHFLEIPQGIESFVEWPEDLNFQFRPLYLRVTRNPLVLPLPRARISSLKRLSRGYRVVVTQDPIYIDYDLCTGCGRCMEECPLKQTEHPPLTRSPAYCPSRALELDKRKISPCRANCPLGVNVQAYMALTAASRFDEALAVIREDNPLPGVCGRVCHHPCETSCRRNEMDQAVAIRDIKRFLSDREVLEHRPRFNRRGRPRRPHKIAVIGSGPAGLTAAHFLNREGFTVTVFEALPEAGGMLRAGINAFRLPREVLDAEIAAIVEAGVEIRTHTTISSVEELFDQGFNAVLLATGTHKDLRLNIPGEDLENIIHCVKFLSGINLYGTGRVGPRTVVIGAGNSAMDAARTALRLGAEEVTVLAIEKEDEMPAHPREVREAAEEGVQFRLEAAPTAFEGESGRVRRIIYRNARWSEPDSEGNRRIEYLDDQTFSLEADTVIVSIGQQPHLSDTGLASGIKTGRGRRVIVDDRYSTSRPGVFAAGDVVTGPSTVITSMAEGRRVAGRIIEYLTGEKSPFMDLSAETRGVGDYIEISENIPRQWRPEMAQRQPKVRRRDFKEVDFGFTLEQAVSEARRCLQCSSCCECRACENACRDIGAIDHFKSQKKLTFISSAVIVADEEDLPDKGVMEDEGVLRMEGLHHVNDLVNLLIAGSASAGKAMVQIAPLRATAQNNTRKPSKPSDLNDEARLGVFICTCNGTMAPESILERIRDLAAGVEGVRHSGLVFSACHPQGADQIARAVRKWKLSRVILASCACCPLEFQCISCNDQRTRARIHLFDRLGLERSRFEMINLKDHLIIEGLSEEEIFERARDIMRGAFIRARFMGPLRQGTTEIGRRILILGGSEVGISCALNLDHQGFQVRLVHQCRTTNSNMPEYIRNRPLNLVKGRGIIHVKEAVIKEIRGHVGDFTTVVRVDGAEHRWRSDIICLTDENILQLAIPEDMTGLKKFYRYDFAFFHTPQVGLYRVMPRTMKRVHEFEAGAALAAQVATAAAEAFMKDHELSPRIDADRCRGCGRCADICPFDAIKLVADGRGIYTAEIMRHNCVGCGGCVGRCPVTAMDMPYFSNQLLEEMVIGSLTGER